MEQQAYVRISLFTPVAQWIERRPPEPKARVRVSPGVLTCEADHLKMIRSFFCGGESVSRRTNHAQDSPRWPRITIAAWSVEY